MVASTICKAALQAPLPASASRITSQMPLSAHRRDCRKIEFQLPNSSGRSRHGAPVRISQNTVRARGDDCAADGLRDGSGKVRNTPTPRRSSVRESRPFSVDLPLAHAQCVAQSQDFANLAHRRSLGGHRISPRVTTTGDRVRDSIADSESFTPASQGGRLPSESVAGLPRNHRPLCVGLRSSSGAISVN